MLFGLAEQGNAPKALLRLNRRGVPVPAVAASAVVTGLCVLINYLAPGNAFELMMALAVSALMINWVMISLTHLRFRKAMQRQGVVPVFKALWYPFGNLLCLVFMAGILVIMLMIPGVRVSVFMIPVWVLVLWVFYRVKVEKTGRVVEAV
ncbi:Aromatic amino acid transport protein AroP [compost metagenome]